MPQTQRPLEILDLQQDLSTAVGSGTGHRRGPLLEVAMQKHQDHRATQEVDPGLLRICAIGLRQESREEQRDRGRLLLQAGRQDHRQPTSNDQGYPHPLRGLNHQRVPLLIIQIFVRSHPRRTQSLHSQLQQLATIHRSGQAGVCQRAPSQEA